MTDLEETKERRDRTSRRTGRIARTLGSLAAVGAAVVSIGIATHTSQSAAQTGGSAGELTVLQDEASSGALPETTEELSGATQAPRSTREQGSATTGGS